MQICAIGIKAPAENNPSGEKVKFGFGCVVHINQRTEKVAIIMWKGYSLAKM